MLRIVLLSGCEGASRRGASKPPLREKREDPPPLRSPPSRSPLEALLKPPLKPPLRRPPSRSPPSRETRSPSRSPPSSRVRSPSRFSRSPLREAPLHPSRFSFPPPPPGHPPPLGASKGGQIRPPLTHAHALAILASAVDALNATYPTPST